MYSLVDRMPLILAPKHTLSPPPYLDNISELVISAPHAVEKDCTTKSVRQDYNGKNYCDQPYPEHIKYVIAAHQAFMYMSAGPNSPIYGSWSLRVLSI